MQPVIVFEGINEDDFFIISNKIINSLENNIFVDDIILDKMRIGILECNESENITKKIKIVERKIKANEMSYINKSKDLNEVVLKSKNGSFNYYLRIINSGDDGDFDVTPLRYFSILRRRYNEKIFMGIEEKKISNIQRIGAYTFIDNLSDINEWKSEWRKDNKENKNDFFLHIKSESFENSLIYNQAYIISNTINRFAIHNIGSLNKIIPCIFMDWEWQVLLADSVENHFTPFNFIKENCKEEVNIRKDLIYKIQNELLKKDNKDWINRGIYNNKTKQEWKKFLYEFIIRDICIDNLLDGRIIKENNEEIIFELCRNMSMLSLLLFSSFCHFIYDTTKKELDKVQINNLCQSAQDFAEGLLQLTENALEYSQGSCFSFRIHTGKSNYFEDNYKEVVIDKTTYYLEVLLTDINYNENIPERFVKKLKERVLNNELPKELVENITSKITLSEFFEPTKEMQTLWDEYYTIAENVTNHYGLQLFNTLVSYYRGYFSVRSESSAENKCVSYSVNYGKRYKLDEEIVKEGIPGTQYSILLPIKRQQEQERIGIDIHPTYNDIALKKKWKNNKVCFEKLLDGTEKITFTNNREYKKESIKKITENFDKEYQNEKVFVIDFTRYNGVIQADIFSKAMISFILHHQNDQLRIALINVDHNFMVEFTRYFAIFYNKNATCTAMKETQLFLCDKEHRTEVCFVGQSLAATCVGNEQWANAKGEYNQCLELLQIILKQRTTRTNRSIKNVKVAPFELLVKDNGITLFEKRVGNDLINNIQKESFGCMLEDVHMRVGAKMHVVDHFFETFQLFNSSLYNSRFAYLIAENINEEIKSKKIKKQKGNIVLVGYDTYSELLVLETKNVLEKLYKISVRAIIYEQTPHPNFRFWKEDMTDSMFVIIVPTSTTLTTHGKIIVELERKANRDISSSILLNIALILIRDSSEKIETGILSDGTELKNNLTIVEKNYWYAIQNENGTRNVRTKTHKQEKVIFNVLVQSKWQEQLECRSCYPMDSLLKERPIIEVNRASVVPMIMAGPKESSLHTAERSLEQREKIELLKEVMCYGHGKRKNNHFQYYFKTDELMQNILDKSESKIVFMSWLNMIKENIINQRKKLDKEVNERFHQLPYIYDILVAPIHETNATFLEKVNSDVFNGVPIVLYIDSDREYRENIQSKYSNLTALYYNILQTGRRAIINFHYVDDSINSGIAFRRTHNLLQTLFPQEAYDQNSQIQVNLFQNVILLLNRNSKGSIKGYTHKGEFFSYINLNISSLRNHHENACALCSEVSDYEKIKDRSAINSMALYWRGIIRDKGVIEVEKMKQKEETRDRYFRRLVCTHMINSSLDKVGWERNNPSKTEKILKQIILNSIMSENITKDLKMEYIMSYFVVLSRPYLSYRKSILDVVFPIVLQVLEGILNEDSYLQKNSNEDFVNLICEEFIKTLNAKIKKDFLKVMINCASRLGACYLIRVEVLNRIFKLAKKIGFSEDEFEMFYGAEVKRLITLGKDESSGLWLEYLIQLGYEYGGNPGLKLNIRQDFIDLLFFENTYIIEDAIEELRYKDVRTVEDIDEYIDEYYFDNFRKLMSIDYFEDMSKYMDTKNKEWESIKEILLGMVKIRKHLAENESNSEDYYTHLLHYIKEITGAKYTCIYGIDGRNQKNQIYVIGSTTENYYHTEDFREIERKRKNECNSANYLKESVYFYDHNKVVLCLTEKDRVINRKDYKMKTDNDNVVKEEIENIDMVWLMLEFNDNLDCVDILKCSKSKFAIRNILVHRSLLWARLRDDFRKDTFTRIKELSMKNELLSISKTGSHTPDVVLKRIENRLQHIEKTSDDILSWAGSLLQLATDSLISKLYVEKIREEGERIEKNNGNELSYEDFTFTKEIKGILNQMTFVNKDKSESDPTYAEIIVENSAQNFCFLCPHEKRFYDLYIIAAIVQNAVKHGKAECYNKVKVNIKLENEYLVIENKLKQGHEIKIKDNEAGNAITMVALDHYFKKYYNKEMLTKIDMNANIYRVKIPVVWKKKTEEGDKSGENESVVYR